MKVNIFFVLILLSAITAIHLETTDSFLYGYFKALTTILIMLFLIVLVGAKNQYNLLILAGLAFSLVGDVLLLNDRNFIYGLSSFLIAHLFFACAFKLQNQQAIKFKSLAMFLFIGGSYFFFLLPNLGSIAIPVAIYISVIIIMSWQGTELYFSNKSNSNLAIFIGAILFLISDASLAFNKFIEEFHYSSVLILGTYWLAITLFASSTVLNKNRIK